MDSASSSVSSPRWEGGRVQLLRRCSMLEFHMDALGKRTLSASLRYSLSDWAGWEDVALTRCSLFFIHTLFTSGITSFRSLAVTIRRQCAVHVHALLALVWCKCVRRVTSQSDQTRNNCLRKMLKRRKGCPKRVIDNIGPLPELVILRGGCDNVGLEGRCCCKCHCSTFVKEYCQ